MDRDGAFDVAVRDGKIAVVAPDISPGDALEVIDVSGKLVLPGMIDTHAHVYEHVTGKFGLNADMVGVRSGVTTLVDQGGPSCMTIPGFREFIVKPSDSQVLCFISCYLVGGLEGHLYPDLYGPGGVDIGHTTRSAVENADIVRGIKAHAEIGGASRWGLEVIKLGKEISRAADLPLYIHLGQLWPTAESASIDADEVVRALLPLMEAGDVLAHPFTRHPGGFVSDETGEVHPVVWEAIDRGVKVDVGHGSHFSFDMARQVIEAGLRPDTLGADLHGLNVRKPKADAANDERTSHPFFGVAPFSLPIAMSELLALGMTLPEVVATVTSNAAEMLREIDRLGALAPGRVADISILDPLTGRFRLTDNTGAELIAELLLHPAFCLRAGRRFDADSPLLPDASLLAA
jgi:dihydroorotase